MKKLRKFMAPMVGGVLLVMLLLNGVLVSATPAPPTPPEPTTCTDCQAEQDAYDAAYADLENVISDISLYAEEISTLLMAMDPMDALEGLSYASTGTTCEDDTNVLAYYSVFDYDGTPYCFANETEYNDFFANIMLLDPVNLVDWEDIMNNLLDLITDPDTDPDDVEDLLDLLVELLAFLDDCENTNCPECPDCETIAADLAQAMLDLDDLEAEADLLDAELTDLETEIDSVFDQLEQLEQLREEFRQMVLDAGGMVDSDCDGFEPASGQAWGIAHNFGDVQWCLTSESQIQDLIDNLEEYWQNNSSSHLPSEQELNEQLDTLMDDYFAKLDEYFAVLDAIDAQIDLIAGLANDLEACLDELEALQDLGFCLDQDAASMRDLLADVDAEMSEPYEPPEPAPEPSDGPEDAEGHWAEDFIDELFNADVVSGDADTGLFRPNDPIIRAEASKIVVLGNGDTVVDSFFDIFFDVTEDDWFWSFVNTAQELGYFEGYPDGSFGPALSILRAESAAVVLRVLGWDIPEYSTYSFPDITGDEWYADYAEKAYQCGIFEGRLVEGERLFEGASDITRAEFAKIVDLAIFNDMLEAACADFECPDCDAIWDEAEALGAELDIISATLDGLEAQMEDLQTLQDEFRQMVEDAGGMTDADCDGFEPASGQAWGIAHNFGGVQWCFTSESQIQDMIGNLEEYWQTHDSQHLPSVQALQDQINQAMEDYWNKLDEYIQKLDEYIKCLEELQALQDAGYCLE